MSTSKRKHVVVKPTPHAHFSQIAATVKKARAKSGLSLREVAEKTELSYQQILRVENGICSIDSALTVMEALGVPQATRVKVVRDEMTKLAMAS